MLVGLFLHVKAPPSMKLTAVFCTVFVYLYSFLPDWILPEPLQGKGSEQTSAHHTTRPLVLRVRCLPWKQGCFVHSDFLKKGEGLLGGHCWEFVQCVCGGEKKNFPYSARFLAEITPVIKRLTGEKKKCLITCIRPVHMGETQINQVTPQNGPSHHLNMLKTNTFGDWKTN